MATPHLSQENIIEVMQDVIDNILIPKFNELNMNASGKWKDSLVAEAKPYAGIIKGLDYTKYLTEGRESGTRPPIRAIEKWVQAKFGASGKEALSIAFAVANTIKEKGTTWHQKGGSDLLEILESPETINYINIKFSVFIIANVTEEMRRNIRV